MSIAAKAVHEAMAKTGKMVAHKVAKDGGMVTRTVSEVSDKTTVATLIRIGKSLGLELVIEFREGAS